MSQTGYTPILSYGSITPTNVPLAANLTTNASGVELAVNAADGKLFYKDSGGVVQVLASKAGNINVASFQTSLGGLTPSTATTGIVTLAGTLNTTSGGTGLTSFTAGDLPYYAAGTLLSKLSIGTTGQILTSSGTAPQWSTLSGVAVTTFSAGTTGFTPSSATSGAITLSGTLATTNGGTGLTSFTANGVVYASSTSALATGSALTFDGANLGVGVASPTQLIDGTAANPRLKLTATSTGYAASQLVNSSGSSYFARDNSAGSFFGIANGTVIYSSTNDPIGFFLSGTESMRLTSSLLSVVPGATIEGLTVGRGAGAVSSNTAVGASALAATATGIRNTGIGASSLNALTSGAENTSVGFYGLTTNTTGGYNTAVGSQALSNNSTGSYNTAIGQTALALNTTASNNTAVGYGAAYSNTTGPRITAVGSDALFSNTSGSDNTAIGHYAMLLNTTGASNTALGKSALQSNTTASNNTAVGYQAAYSNTTGTGLVAVGTYALLNNTTGSANVAIGGQYNGFSPAALAANTTGSYNIAIGTGALYSNQTSGGAVFIGYQAGYGSVGISTTINYNTGIGYQAGYGLTSGYSNTFIGNAAGSAVTSGYKNTILGSYNGNQGGLDIRTASNHIVLSDGDGNPRGVFDGSGNFLINTAQIGQADGDYCQARAFGGGGWGFQASHLTGTASGQPYLYMVYAGSAIGSITQSGTTAVAYNTSSDYRLKNTITPMTGALAKVALLKPCTYKWNVDGSNGEGFIAHELAEVVPQCVTGKKDAVDAEGKSQYQGIDTSFLVATLTAAIQEQQAIIESLKARLDAANL